jgi:predicted HAD superfamily phosphohydrolase YqeG
VRVPYERLTTTDDVLRRIAALRVRTVIVDVEPMVAFWNTDDHALHRGIAELLDGLAGTEVRTVRFATNSTRVPVSPPVLEGLDVGYRANALKPLRTAAFRGLPGPVAVIGDQSLTDGVLAHRLGATFLHYARGFPGVPLGSRMLRVLGRPLHGLLFQRP